MFTRVSGLLPPILSHPGYSANLVVGLQHWVTTFESQGRCDFATARTTLRAGRLSRGGISRSRGQKTTDDEERDLGEEVRDGRAGPKWERLRPVRRLLLHDSGQDAELPVLFSHVAWAWPFGVTHEHRVLASARS